MFRKGFLPVGWADHRERSRICRSGWISYRRCRCADRGDCDEENLRAAEVGGGAQIAVTGADAEACRELGGFGEDPLRGGVPLVVPVIVAGRDAVDGRHDLAELAGAIAAGSECALGLVPKLDVVGKNGYRACSAIKSSFHTKSHILVRRTPRTFRARRGAHAAWHPRRLQRS